MKKNLRIVLMLTLGLATTVSAQDWSVDSRTRVNSTEDATFNEQRVRTAVDFGGEAVSAHVELNSAAVLGSYANQDFSLSVREAYATTDVMGFASLTAGRMALTFGSGRIMGDNDWVQNEGNTFDGLLVGINNDFADIHFGYSAADNTDSTETVPFAHEGTRMFFNVGKDVGAMGVNLFYMSSQDDVVGVDDVSMGLDASYEMDNGAALTLGYYTNERNGVEMDLTALGVSYPVNDDLKLHAGYDMYGENGFYLRTGSFGDGWGSGMNYSNFNATRGECSDMSVGGSYAMGDLMIGATYHSITPETDGAFEDITVMDLSVGYTLTDNSSISLNYASTDEFGDDETRTWISLHIGF